MILIDTITVKKNLKILWEVKKNLKFLHTEFENNIREVFGFIDQKAQGFPLYTSLSIKQCVMFNFENERLEYFNLPHPMPLILL